MNITLSSETIEKIRIALMLAGTYTESDPETQEEYVDAFREFNEAVGVSEN